MKKGITKVVLAALLCAASSGNSATIGIGTALGAFKQTDGTAATAGGVSIGFFTVALPTAIQLAAMVDPWTELSGANYGYRDVRSLLDSNGNPPTFQSTGWDFSASWSGGTLNVPGTPSNVTNAINGNDLLSAFAGGTGGTATQLWAFGFNGGNYANSFTGSRQWAVVTANALGGTTNDWLYPTSSETISLSQINATGEVLIGTDGASAGISGVGANDVVMALVPEPSTGALMMVGAFGLAAMRRLRKV